MRQWKLSTMDLESITHWEDYSRAKDDDGHTEVRVRTVESDVKKRARST